MSIQFEDFSMKVKSKMNEEIVLFLYEAAESLRKQASDNTRVGTGQLKGDWQYIVDEAKYEATIGNPEENAIWEEFGTGEYALKGDGRKGGWFYQDEKDGKFHHTWGKTPNRALQNAFNTLKKPIQERAEYILKKGMNK